MCTLLIILKYILEWRTFESTAFEYCTVRSSVSIEVDEALTPGLTREILHHQQATSSQEKQRDQFEPLNTCPQDYPPLQLCHYSDVKQSCPFSFRGKQLTHTHHRLLRSTVTKLMVNRITLKGSGKCSMPYTTQTESVRAEEKQLPHRTHIYSSHQVLISHVWYLNTI